MRRRAGVIGPERPCACGDQQCYHDQARGLSVQTSVGSIRLAQRACYHCPTRHLTSYPQIEQLGVGQAGHMSRYLQEQCGWLLALLPGRLAQQTLRRFGWPAVGCERVLERASGRMSCASCRIALVRNSSPYRKERTMNTERARPYSTGSGADQEARS